MVKILNVFDFQMTKVILADSIENKNRMVWELNKRMVWEIKCRENRMKLNKKKTKSMIIGSNNEVLN